jgi:glutathione synthase/RimK-type ligase-like ATP-grasp enzyme
MIAIHNSYTGFHQRWISYCEQNNIPYRLIDCYSNNLIELLEGSKVLLWHHHQMNTKDILIAKPILFALEQAGLKVFPDFRTNWHFDDKLGQKYLLEAIGAPLVPTYIFYDKITALKWVKTTILPKVFKLRGGAGSSNVKLVKTKREAIKLIKKSFGKGFSNYYAMGSLKERWRKWRLGKSTFIDVAKGIVRFIYPPPFVKVLGKELGYVYFQDFIPDNDFDIRVVVIDDKAFAIKRMVRKNDFRASGSGFIRYDKDNFKDEWIKLAFDINEKIKSQSLALDFVFDKGQPKVLEISYGFVKEGYDSCVGYWDNNLKWHEGKFDPYGWMLNALFNRN